MGNQKEYTRVTVRVKFDTYIAYKKALLENRTTPTAQINRHIQEYIENANNKKYE